MSATEKRILLADDDTDDQDMLIDALRSENGPLHFVTVSNGRQVLDYLSGCGDNDLPSLIILDFKMPILSAAEVLENIQAEARLAAIPKMVWSTSKQQEHITRCLNAGAAKYFVKPSGYTELKSIARSMVEQSNP